MIRIRDYMNLPKGKILKIKLKRNGQSFFGIFDWVGLLQANAATPVKPTAPINFRYSKSIKSYFENILAYENMSLNGHEIEEIEIITVDF